MAKGGNTKIKVFYLLDALRTCTDEEHRLCVPELVNILQKKYGVAVERKSVYRDMDALVEYGMDVCASQSGYYLGKRRYEISELRLLISAVQAASFISEASSERLVEKLLDELSVYQAAALRAQANIGGVKCGTDETFRTIERVNLAIAEKRRISFFYYKRDISRRNVIQRSGKSYHVSPYAMIWMQDKYYLVGNMDERDDLTHFRLDRMQNVHLEQERARPCGEVSAYEERFDAADYASKCVNMFGGEVRNITLRGELPLVSDVLERFGEDIILRRDEEHEGYFLAYVQAAAGPGFLGWVAQFGPALEIVSPGSLRAQMRERLAKACTLYENT